LMLWFLWWMILIFDYDWFNFIYFLTFSHEAMPMFIYYFERGRHLPLLTHYHFTFTSMFCYWWHSLYSLFTLPLTSTSISISAFTSTVSMGTLTYFPSFHLLISDLAHSTRSTALRYFLTLLHLLHYRYS
jgi:hypothetical protein